MRCAPNIESARRPYHEKARADVEKLRPKKFLGIFGSRAADDGEALKNAEQQLARYQQQHDRYQRQLPEFERFANDARVWVAGKDPHHLMTPSEAEAFAALFARGRTEFEDFVRYTTPYSLDDAAVQTLLFLATADERGYATLPEPVRALINDKFLLPTDSWHQMFGSGVDIQGNAADENNGKHMLLQLMYDDMMGWRFGDMGAYQFWISPADLAKRNWAGVTITFECS